MSALICVVVFLIARVSFGDRIAKWSGWAWAFCPYAIYFPVERIWETWLSTLVVCLLFLITLNLENENRISRWTFFGLLWGVAALTSPSMFSVLPFLAGWVIYRRHRRGQNWIALNVVAAIAFVASSRRGSFATTRSSIASSLSATTWESSCDWRPRARLSIGDPTNLARGTTMRNGKNSSNWVNSDLQHKKKQQAVEFIRANPGWYMRTSIRRAVFLWTGYWSLDREYLKEEPLDPPNIFFLYHSHRPGIVRPLESATPRFLAGHSALCPRPLFVSAVSPT